MGGTQLRQLHRTTPSISSLVHHPNTLDTSIPLGRLRCKFLPCSLAHKPPRVAKQRITLASQGIYTSRMQSCRKVNLTNHANSAFRRQFAMPPARTALLNTNRDLARASDSGGSTAGEVPNKLRCLAMPVDTGSLCFAYPLTISIFEIMEMSSPDEGAMDAQEPKVMLSKKMW